MCTRTNWVVPAVPDPGAHGSKPKAMRTNTFQADWQVAFIAMDWLSISIVPNNPGTGVPVIWQWIRRQ